MTDRLASVALPQIGVAQVGPRGCILGPGLDGWAYMETANYWDPIGEEYELKWDLEAIRWLLDNVVGSPVILEGHTPEYRWGGRYSINTGLPTVLGWNWHQRQQRAAADASRQLAERDHRPRERHGTDQHAEIGLDVVNREFHTRIVRIGVHEIGETHGDGRDRP